MLFRDYFKFFRHLESMRFSGQSEKSVTSCCRKCEIRFPYLVYLSFIRASSVLLLLLCEKEQPQVTPFLRGAVDGFFGHFLRHRGTGRPTPGNVPSGTEEHSLPRCRAKEHSLFILKRHFIGTKVSL